MPRSGRLCIRADVEDRSLGRQTCESLVGFLWRGGRSDPWPAFQSAGYLGDHSLKELHAVSIARGRRIQIVERLIASSEAQPQLVWTLQLSVFAKFVANRIAERRAIVVAEWSRRTSGEQGAVQRNRCNAMLR